MPSLSLSRLLFVALVAAGLSSAAGAQRAGRDPFVFVFDKDEKEGSGTGLAWWLLQSTIRPTGTAVAGVSLDRLNEKREDPMNRWCYASAFSPASFVSPSRRVQAEIDETMRRSGPALFKASGAFTGAAMQDVAVGSYETCDGSVGGFLLITDRARPAPGIVYLEAFPEWQGLMWVAHEGGALTISSCFECGHVQRLYYDKSRSRFYWVNEGD